MLDRLAIVGFICVLAVWFYGFFELATERNGSTPIGLNSQQEKTHGD